ncbi:fimbrial protein [Pseudomonas kermanshahensis]|uniref:fimbrial protein n=1 Tax=Pseudomonas kermanshahensis TaxID=2745482 RepID=UPI0023DB4D86|nr:fimbrial protein [Pseudomonas kermanshahensis]WEL56976.1 fimbrial protein [Pseudomonas kermanshahensis]
MKRKLIALPLGLFAGLMGSSAFASSVFFEGSITAETCPIEIVNPGDGSVDNRVAMGDVPLGSFGGVAGTEVRGATFAVRVPDKGSCGVTENNANVTFNGDADGSGSYFKVNPVSGAATGVSIVIRDSSKASVAPGGTSVDYPLNANGPTDLKFDAYYRSTAATVTAGPASAHVRYSVAYK